VSGNEDVAASAVVVLLEFLIQSFHDRVPGTSGTEGCDEAILLSSRASWKLLFWVPRMAMTRRGATLQRCSIDAVVSEVMPQPYPFFDFKLLVVAVHARPEQAVSRVNLRALIHSVGFELGEVVYRPPVSGKVLTLDQDGEHLLQLHGSKMFILIRLYHYVQTTTLAWNNCNGHLHRDHHNVDVRRSCDTART
jgi:hypothetical protein